MGVMRTEAGASVSLASPHAVRMTSRARSGCGCPLCPPVPPREAQLLRARAADALTQSLTLWCPWGQGQGQGRPGGTGRGPGL